MDNKFIRLFTGEGVQRRKEALNATVSIVDQIRLYNKSRPLNNTIEYLEHLCKNMDYKG